MQAAPDYESEQVPGLVRVSLTPESPVVRLGTIHARTCVVTGRVPPTCPAPPLSPAPSVEDSPPLFSPVWETPSLFAIFPAEIRNLSTQTDRHSRRSACLFDSI